MEKTQFLWATDNHTTLIQITDRYPHKILGETCFTDKDTE